MSETLEVVGTGGEYGMAGSCGAGGVMMGGMGSLGCACMGGGAAVAAL